MRIRGLMVGVALIAAGALAACSSDSGGGEPSSADGGGATGADATQAGADAGQAGADAGQAGADAGQAGTDTGQAGTDTGQAGTDAGQQGGDAGGAAHTLTLGTFNAGLAVNFVPYADERTPEVAKAVANATDLDVLCLEEVWLPDQIDAIQTAAADHFPNVFVQMTEDTGGGEPACTQEEAQPLLDCATTNCTGAADLAGCVLSKCGAEFGATSQACQGCLAANVDKTLDEIAQICTQGSSTYAWGGHNGLMLLSTVALEEQDWLDLQGTLVRRIALHARTPDGLHIFCTHLTANLTDVPYNGPADSWGAEQATQIDALLAWVDEKTGGTEPAVILGDLNTGPAVGDVAAELPDNFNKFMQAGWTSAYLTQLDPPPCTFCADNPLTDSTTSEIIDHILAQSPASGSDPARIFDQPLTLTTQDGDVDARLSDHYGVRTTVSW